MSVNILKKTIFTALITTTLATQNNAAENTQTDTTHITKRSREDTEIENPTKKRRLDHSSQNQFLPVDPICLPEKQKNEDMQEKLIEWNNKCADLKAQIQRREWEVIRAQSHHLVSSYNMPYPMHSISAYPNLIHPTHTPPPTTTNISITQQIINQMIISGIHPTLSRQVLPLPLANHSEFKHTANKPKNKDQRRINPPFHSLTGKIALEIAQRHRDIGAQEKTQFRHTGLVVAKLCQGHRDLNVSNSLTEMKDDIGSFCAALYLRGDAGLLWQRYLKIEDFEKCYIETKGKFTSNYVRQTPENIDVQKNIKMKALKIAALLGNKFAMDTMDDLKLEFTEEEKAKKENPDYIKNLMKQILDLMMFVPKNQF